MICIYKIESPSRKIYVGQTRNYKKRVYRYKILACKGQKYIYHSLAKYGFDSHKFEIITILPPDISQEVLDDYERFYIQHYSRFYISLNLSSGGTGGKGDRRRVQLTFEQSQKIRDRMKGNRYSVGYKQSEETKKKRLETRRRNKLRAKILISRGINPYRILK